MKVYSAYEYLEHRFNLAVRGLGATIFVLWRVGWMATAMYVPCLAISTAMGRTDLLQPMIVGLGSLVTFYTMLGGIRAVIWTDVTQFCIMFLGLFGTLMILLVERAGRFYGNFFRRVASRQCFGRRRVGGLAFEHRLGIEQHNVRDNSRLL